MGFPPDAPVLHARRLSIDVVDDIGRGPVAVNSRPTAHSAPLLRRFLSPKKTGLPKEPG
jgi:hypothetical protein